MSRSRYAKRSRAGVACGRHVERRGPGHARRGSRSLRRVADAERRQAGQLLVRHSAPSYAMPRRGHQLHNDASGLDRIVSAGVACTLPHGIDCAGLIIGLRNLWLGLLAVALATMRQWLATGPVVCHGERLCVVADAAHWRASSDPASACSQRRCGLPTAGLRGGGLVGRAWRRSACGACLRPTFIVLSDREKGRREPVAIVDLGFILAVVAFGSGLSLATLPCRSPAASAGPWAPGSRSGPRCRSWSASCSLLLATAYALARGYGGYVLSASAIPVFGVAWAAFWTGFLRVGAQSALLLAPGGRPADRALDHMARLTAGKRLAHAACPATLPRSARPSDSF